MKETNLIGEAVHFYDEKYRVAIRFLNGIPLTEIKKVVQEYNALQILPPFTNDTLKQLARDRGEAIGNEYLKLSQKDLARFTNPILRQDFEDKLQVALLPFRKAAEKIRHGFFDPNPYGDMFHLEAFEIVEGEPVLNETHLREKYTLRITTERQAIVYEKAQAVIDAAKVLANELQGTYLDPAESEWITGGGVWGVFNRLEGSGLSLNPVVLERL